MVKSNSKILESAMVKSKHQKSSKSENQSHIKKHGKQADISQFRAQLDPLGLKIIKVIGDGNCFFRAIADQLEGNEDEHMKYRSMVVQFIMKHREMFEPFIEDDVPFDEYCESMENDGTFAGNMELQAASLVTHCNICIHVKMSPRWHIHNFDNREARMIHLVFHDSEQHYNSVRLKEDPCSGPARPIIIKADDDLSGKSYQEKPAVTKATSGAGCFSDNHNEKVEDCSLMQQSCSKIEKAGYDTKFQHVEKNIPKNKDCPCGSKKKYKSCCGTVAARSSARISVHVPSQTVDHGKSRKDRKQGKKGASSSLANLHASDRGLPDLGALRI